MVLRREILRTPEQGEPFDGITAGLIAVAAGRGVFVYDDIDGVVKEIDTTGQIIARLGGRGAGPGEFRAPTAIAVDSAGVLWVADLAKQAFVRFSSTGAVLQELPISGVPAGGPVRLVADAALLLTLEADTRTRTLKKRLVRMRGDSQEVLASADAPLPRGVRFPGCPVPIVVPRVFTPELHWSASGRTLVIAEVAEYRITVREGAASPKSIGREIKPARASAIAAAEALKSSGMVARQGTCNIPMDALVNAGGYETEIPVIEDLSLSPEGKLWVRRHGDTGARGSIDVFSPTGSYTGTLQQTDPFPVTFVTESLFLSVTTDSDGSSHLYEYGIEGP